MDLQQRVVELTLRDNYTAGIRAAAAGTRELNTETAVTDVTVTRASKSIEALTLRYDRQAQVKVQLAKMERRHTQELADYEAQAARVGRSEEALSAIRAGQAADYTKLQARLQSVSGVQVATAATAEGLAKSTGQAAYQMKQLSLQMPDVVQGILGGQSAFQVLLQQGGQMVQVMGGVRAALRGVGAVMVSALASPVGAALAVTAAIAGVGAAAEINQRTLIDLSASLRGTRADYAALAETVDATAKRLAATSSLDTADARAAGKVIAAVPGFSGDSAQLESLIKLSKDLSVAMGVDVPEAAKQLAAALKDPAGEAQKLADGGLRSMSQALAYSIKLQAEAGDKVGAYNRVLAALRETYDGTDKDQTKLGASLRGLSEAFSKTGQDGKSLATALGEAVTSAAALAVSAITGVVNSIEDLRQAAARVDAEKRMRAGLAPGGGAVAGGNAATTPDASGLPVFLGPEIPGRPAGDNRAVGLFQLLPSTAAGLGVNPNTQDQNIFGGLAYIRQLSQMPGIGNDQARIAGAYNRGPSGFLSNPSAAAGYQGKVGAASPSQLPADVASQIEYWGQILGLPPDLINLGQRIAVVESGGRQYARAGSSITVTAPPVQDGIGSGGISAERLAALRGERIIRDDAFAAYRSSGALSVQLGDNRARQQLLELGINQAQQRGDTQAVQQLGEALAKTKREAHDLIEEQAKLARSASESVEPLKAEEGATRDLAIIRAQFKEAAKGGPIDEGALLQAQKAKLTELTLAFNDSVAAIDRDTASQQRLVAAYETGGVAAERAANREKAVETVRKSSIPNTDERRRQEDALTDALNRNADAARDKVAAQDVNQFNQQIDLTKTELGLLTATAGERARELAIMQERLKLGLKYGEQATAAQQKALDAAATVATLQQQLQSQKATIDAIGSSLTQAFDQVGQAITSAFVQGQGAAVNWGNVARGAVTSVLQQVLKLGVINPLTNAVLGTSAPSLLAGLGGGGGASTATGGGSSLLSGSGSIFQMLGLGNTLGAFDGVKSTLLNAIGLPQGLSTVIGGGYSSASAAAGAALPGFEGMMASNTAGAAASGAITAGSALGAVGLGFGAGTLLNSLIGGKSTGGMVGSAAGSGIGALIGSIGGPPGMLIGALLGGMAGGGLGGLIGPPKANHGWSYTVSPVNGLLQTRDQYIDPKYAAQYQQEQQQIAAVNRFLASSGVSAQGYAIVGGNNGGKYGEVGNFGDAAGKLSFTADGALGTALQGRTFGSFEALQNMVADFKQVEATIASLTTDGDSTDAFTQQIKALQDTYSSAIAKAQEYHLAEEGLVAARDKAIAKLEAERQAQIDAVQNTVQERLLRAQGQTMAANLFAFDSARPAAVQELTDKLKALGVASEAIAGQVSTLNTALDIERQKIIDAAAESYRRTGASLDIRLATALGRTQDAELAQQAESARTELQGLRDSLREAGATAQATSEMINKLEETQGAERAAIVKKYADAAAASLKAANDQLRQLGGNVQAWITAQKATGASGASPSDQFTAAQAAFAQDSALARGGNVDALGRITSTADTLLSAGAQMYASGSQFQTLRAMVISTLESLPATKSYNEQILDALNALGGSVDVAVDVAVIRVISETLNALPQTERDQLVKAETVLRDIEQRIGRNLTAVEADSIVNDALVGRYIGQYLGRDLTLSERNALLYSADVVRQIEQSIGRTLTPSERLLVYEPGSILRNVDQTVQPPSGPPVIDGGQVTRYVIQTIESTETIQISRSIDDKLSGLIGVSNQQLATQNQTLAAILSWSALTGNNTSTLVANMGQSGQEAGGRQNAFGNAFSGGNVVPFAKGGLPELVNRPTLAPMALFGEAGPEAIVPLVRMADGSLGVASRGSRGDDAALLAILQAILKASAAGDIRIIEAIQELTARVDAQTQIQRRRVS